MTDLPEISRAAGLQFPPTARLGPRLAAIPTMSNWKSPPRMPRAAQQIDTVADTRAATVNIHYSLSLLPEERLSAAAGRRSNRLFRHRVEGLFAQGGRRSLRPLYQPLGLAKGRSVGRAFAAQEADRLLDRKDGPLQIPQADPRGDFGMEQGLRKGRLRSMPSKSASSPTTPIGMPKTSTTTHSAGSPPAPASRWGRRGPIRLPGKC